MDITVVFKSCVKTIRTRNRAIGEWSCENEKSKILASRRDRFSVRCREVVQQVSHLRDFLAEHRKAYLNFSNHLPEVPRMTDFERDKIDSGAQRIINTCTSFINDLEREIITKNTSGSQLSEHQQTALKLMKEYLKQVCKIYSEQRAIRVKRTVEMKRMSRINSSGPKKMDYPIENSSRIGKDLVAGGDSAPLLQEESLTPEELQMFQLENDQLFNELNNLTDEVKQIENKVVRIAELQDIFTEKVLEQDKDIDRIAATIVGTTENVKDANDQIRRAIQRNAGLRVWILFFLLVISFSLLFLDWYND